LGHGGIPSVVVHSPFRGMPISLKGITTMSQHHAYIEKMKHQLDELNLQMAALDAKAKDARAEARDTYRKEMDKLRHQSQLAAARMDEMKAATEETWESMVIEMEKVRDAFIHSFKYFKSQI
jgi:hypothetical protein